MAIEGYYVVVTDCFHGETIETIPDFATFANKYPYESVSKDIDATIAHLLAKGVSKDSIAALGFCWGAWAIAKSASEGVQWKCAASPHPATKLEPYIFAGDEEAMLGKVECPFLLMPAGDDPDNVKPGSEIVKKLEEKGGMSVPFDRMVHGFVTRGDLSLPDVKEDAEKALELATDFIKKHC